METVMEIEHALIGTGMLSLMQRFPAVKTVFTVHSLLSLRVTVTDNCIPVLKTMQSECS